MNSNKKTAAIFGDNQERIDTVFTPAHTARLQAQTDFYPHVITSENFEQHADELKNLQVIFSTWGMPALPAAQLDALGKLKAVFYAAGSVQKFAAPLLERGVLVVGSRHAIGEAVAQFVLAQIILSNKGYFANVREFDPSNKRAKTSYGGCGNYDAVVAILGVGAIGRRLIEWLKLLPLHVIAFDPFLEEAEAKRLGVEKVSLQDAFARANVVTNHMAAKPETDKIINRALLESMRPGAAFINSARGQAVDEAALAAVWKERPDLTALLDVTSPEPPLLDSPLLTLPNVQISSHLAGSMGNELRAMTDFAIEEFEAWQRGDQLRGAVTLEELARLA